MDPLPEAALPTAALPTAALPTAPLEPEPDPALSSPMVPAQCVAVLGASGRLAIEVRNQRELDALAGCSTIVGDLVIQDFEGVDLRPLASLRAVRGGLALGPVYGELPARGFPSLDGLDNLEAVAGLALRGVLAPSLRALGSLRRFVPFAEESALSSQGYVFIEHCPQLTDLSGLERLEGLEAVFVKSNANLTSLRGLQIPARMVSFEVWDSPVEDLGDVSRLTNLSGSLWFNHTGLRSAAGLERLARVDQLQFWGNAQLRDLSDLSALTSLTYFNVVENPLLEVLPGLAGVESLTGFSVSDNPALREIPGIPLRSLREAWIERNASLERVFTGSTVRQMYQLRVANNPQLRVLDLSELQSVTDLWVTHNPALDDTALGRFDSSGPGRVRIAGNLGQALPLAECPWIGDGTCDEVPNPYGVCAEGTDPDCIGLEQ